jgi:baculoviral IAP repeat-containing protein 6
VLKDVPSLYSSLPVHWNCTIAVRLSAGRPDMLRALFLPHCDTPYGNGAFLFDILLPAEYPNRPPMVQFLTTGSGSVRFNPNLYNCGKVGLSLLPHHLACCFTASSVVPPPHLLFHSLT